MERGKSAVRLFPWHEAVGVLEEIVREDDRIIIRLSHYSSIEMPIHLYEDLKPKIGKRVSILRTGRDYRFRILPDESSVEPKY